MKQNLDFRIDYLRLVISLKYSPRMKPFVTEKGTKINRVRLDQTPEELLSDVLELMGLSFDMASVYEVTQNHAFFGYNRLFKVKGIKFMWVSDDEYYKQQYRFTDDVDDNTTIQPLADMGLCLDLTGAACRELESILDSHGVTLFEFLKRLRFRYPKLKVSRLDLTLDILQRMQGVTPLAFYRQFAQGLVTCTTHAWDYNDGGDDRHGSMGSTLYIGKRTADFFLRIYDKQKERYYRHGDTWLDPNGFRIRWEAEVKHKLGLEVLDRAIAINEDMYGFYQIFLDLLATKIWVSPSAKQLAKGNYHKVLPINTKAKRPRPLPMANWYYNLIQPKDRKRIRLTHLAPYKTGGKLVEMTTTKAFFQKMQVHILHGGDPVKLVAHWLQQGKLKANDKNYNALIHQLKTVDYDPSIIDNMLTSEEAYKILHDVAKYRNAGPDASDLGGY